MFLKILRSALVIGAVTIITVTATKAAWSDSVTIENNIFQTGTLDIATTPSMELFDTSLSPIFPGWNETSPLVVTNSGTVPLKYTITPNKISGDDELYSSNNFRLKIGTNEAAGDIFGNESGSQLSTLTTTARTINPGKSEQLFFTASLDQAAGNNLQGKKAIVSFSFNAN